jgi:hypothetical protein
VKPAAPTRTNGDGGSLNLGKSRRDTEDAKKIYAVNQSVLEAMESPKKPEEPTPEPVRHAPAT